ncbi:MAG: AI-2E family transporter [Pseudorhizobium sp.]
MIQPDADARTRDRWRVTLQPRPVSIVLIFAIVLLLLVMMPATLLMIFAGFLLAILFRMSGTRIARLLSIGPGWGVAIFLLGLLAIMAAIGLYVAPAIAEQAEELWQQVPAAVQGLRERLEAYTWGRQLLERLEEGGLMSSASGGMATQAVSSAFGYLGNTVLLLFIALYGAFDPATYRKGFITLFAPSVRAKAERVLDHSVKTLESWLAAQLISMTVVGVLTGVGLWLIGIPLALLLGLIAGLLAFIPNVGPVLAATPGLLLAVPEGLNSVLLVLGVYLAVQMLESYIVTPLVQQEKVSLPPVLVISTQLMFASLFGLIGLALATPLTALIMQLVSDLYVDDYLEKEERPLVEV